MKEQVNTLTCLYNPSIQTSRECLVINWMVNSHYGRYQIYLDYFYWYVRRVRVRVSGSKAPIRLSGRGRSCLTKLVDLGCLGAEGDFSRIFNQVYLFVNKTCTWKRGHGRH